MINDVTVIKMGTDKSFIHIGQVSLGGKNFGRYLRTPIIFLALMIFSLRCFSKDKLGWRIRPKCFCSFTFAPADPLNIR